MVQARRLLLAGAALLLLAAVLVGSSGGEDKPAATVRMTADKKFVPAKVTIKVGQTVQWMAEDQGRQHSVTTDPSRVEDPSLVQIPKGAKPFSSGLIEPGKSFRYRFAVPGTYRYACPPHEADNMIGEVEVAP